MIILRCDPNTPVPPQVIAHLVGMGIPYCVEIWSTTGFWCCWCGKHLGAVPYASRNKYPCPRCYRDLWCRTLENGVLVVSSDNWVERWGR